MSLTNTVTAELLRVTSARVSTRSAELATMLRLAGGLHNIAGRIAVEVELEDQDIAARIRRDIAEIYGLKSEGRISPSSSTRTAPIYLVRVLDGGETLARQTGLLDSRRRPIRGLPNKITTANLDDLAAVWRGAFLAAGAVTDPGRSAALEVSCPTNEVAMALVGAASRLGVNAKAREVRGAHRVVVREDDSISSLLTQMGATAAVAEWNELRQRREVRANANRLVNFDDANLRRSAQAAVAACARVERAMDILGDDVPEHLAYAGKLRIDFRDASLDELGHHANPPMTKDAVAGRIRRLLAMADKRAADLGIDNTSANLPDELDD
ncbi:MAG: DNA-binding protein WhiA [Microbacteriaceae bacterium]